MLGIVFTLISAFFFGISTVSMRRGVASGSALNGLYLTLLPGVPLFWLAALATGQLFEIDRLDRTDVLLLIAAGLVHFIVGRYCTLRAMAALGANRASTVIVTSVLVSVGLAVLFLGEGITPLMGVGIALVIVGPAVAAGSSKPKRTPVAVAAPAAGTTAVSYDDLPRARLVRGYSWAIVNAVAFGTSPLFIREALGDTGLGVLGGAISYTAAGVLLVAVLLMPGQIQSVRSVDPTTRNWFLVSALTIMVAQTFRFLGIAHAPVTVAVPLLRGGAVFIYIMSYYVNRDIESFSGKVILGTGIALVGAIALVI
ncbi:MAG: DMT family transporter [Chloroflexi bacterium]|nr:DMT family transporter [Chloroflexota bacterium]MDA1173029.1 DMT family transporter [Chloroflexota bacterium]